MANEPSTETQQHSTPEVKMLSNRSFGLIFAGIFLLIGSFPMLFGGHFRMWAAYAAAVFAVPALLYPPLLTPLNHAWMKFGQFMHRIINPILMGLVFYITILPTGLILRLLGKDPMRRKFQQDAESYWIEREQRVIDKSFFENQF